MVLIRANSLGVSDYRSSESDCTLNDKVRKQSGTPNFTHCVNE